MAYLTTATSAPRSSAVNAASGALRAPLERFLAWRSYRITVKALAALSDAELDDIGISRGEIKYVARTAR